MKDTRHVDCREDKIEDYQTCPVLCSYMSRSDVALAVRHRL